MSREQNRDNSAFITQGGCFRFTVMPFRLTCAPSVFQQLMDIVLCGLSYLTCLVYLGDVIVFGRSFHEQLDRLRQVFDRLARANLKLKPSKCSLCQRSVDFLGHVVSTDGIAMQDAILRSPNGHHAEQSPKSAHLWAYLDTTGDSCRIFTASQHNLLCRALY